MERLFPLRVMAVAIASFLLMFSTSCVNEEYDMSEDNLNLEVTPFQEGLTLPLGSTEQIKLKDVLADVDFEALKAGADGAYSIGFSDEFDMSEELSSLKDMVEIPDVDVSRDISFRLNDVDVSDVKVEGQDYSFDYDLGSSFSVPELEVPSVDENIRVAAGMDSFRPSSESIELDFGSFEHDTHLMSISDDLHVPDALINDTPIPLDGDLLGSHMSFSDEFSFVETTEIKLSLPAGINSVEDIVLHEGAAMKVTIELKESFLHSGDIIPEIDIDLHNLFHLDASYNGDVAHLADDFILSEKNGYRQTNTYTIASLAVEPEDWSRENADSPLVLDKEIELDVQGSLVFRNLMTTTRLVETSRNIDIYMALEFIDLQIDDIVMGVDPVELSIEDEVGLSLGDVNLPDEIEAVSSVSFAEGSGLDINLTAENISRMRGLEAELESLVFSFPEELKVSGAGAGNRIEYKVEDLSEGFAGHIEVTGMELPAPVAGKIEFNKTVEVQAVAKAGGILHLADLPLSEEDDLRILVDVEADLEIEDYEVEFAGYDYVLEVEPEEISVELPDEMKDLKEITIVPDGSPEVVIDLEMPDLGLEIVPGAQGLSISFPEMFRFKTPLPSEYNYSLADNSVTLKGRMPSEIRLPVDRIVLVPAIDPVDGKVYAKGFTALSGAVSAKSCTMNKAEVERLASADMSVAVTARIPEMIPATVGFDKFETSIREEMKVKVISAGELPAEVVSMGLVELEDTYLDLLLDASGLPDLGAATLQMDLTVDLPDMIRVSGVDMDSDGNLKLEGELDSRGYITLPAIKIDALNLSGVDFSKGEDISCDIVIDGSVSMSNASLDVDKWLGKDLDVKVKAAIDDITISRLTGRMDYKVDPVVEAIDLGEFAEAISGEGLEAELDFCRAHLMLEVKTNLGVAVDADMMMVPYYDGKADESKAVKAGLSLSPSASAAETRTTRFWIAASPDDCPAGYEFVEADILGILRDIPEKLEVRLAAGTDPESDCVLEPSAEYTLSAAYRFDLPLEFGEKFCVTFKDTLSGMPDIVGQLISKGRINLKGGVTSTLPAGLEVFLKPMDSNGRYVPLADGCGSQKISPCGLDGSPVKTELDLMLGLADGAATMDISAIELLFKVTSAGVTGVPLKEDASIQADLRLVLPEGLTLDLDEMMEE